MSCVIEKDCKRAAATKRRGFDLSWSCANRWRAGMLVSIGFRIRPVPSEIGGDGVTGYELEAVQGGQTGDEAPAFDIGPDDQVFDGSVIWGRRALSEASLQRSISSPSDVEWDSDSPLTVDNPQLVNSGGAVLISADHAGGSSGTRRRSRATVTFTDGTVDQYVIDWKIQ